MELTWRWWGVPGWGRMAASAVTYANVWGVASNTRKWSLFDTSHTCRGGIHNNWSYAVTKACAATRLISENLSLIYHQHHQQPHYQYITPWLYLFFQSHEQICRLLIFKICVLFNLISLFSQLVRYCISWFQEIFCGCMSEPFRHWIIRDKM